MEHGKTTTADVHCQLLNQVNETYGQEGRLVEIDSYMTYSDKPLGECHDTCSGGY